MRVPTWLNVVCDIDSLCTNVYFTGFKYDFWCEDDFNHVLFYCCTRYKRTLSIGFGASDYHQKLDMASEADWGSVLQEWLQVLATSRWLLRCLWQATWEFLKYYSSSRSHPAMNEATLLSGTRYCNSLAGSPPHLKRPPGGLGSIQNVGRFAANVSVIDASFMCCAMVTASAHDRYRVATSFSAVTIQLFGFLTSTHVHTSSHGLRH